MPLKHWAWRTLRSDKGLLPALNERFKGLEAVLKEWELDVEALEAAPPAHDHDDRYYTETEADALLAGKSDVGHTHDGRYYTETEIDNMRSLPFLRQGGASAYVPISTQGELPFFRSGGTQQNIPLAT